jgi:hypothetical protein
LRVEVYNRNYESGWRPAGDQLRATSFLLEDETGTVWVDAQGVDKYQLGEGVIPSREAAETAAILTGIPPVNLNADYRAWLWELRGG